MMRKINEQIEAILGHFLMHFGESILSSNGPIVNRRGESASKVGILACTNGGLYISDPNSISNSNLLSCSSSPLAWSLHCLGDEVFPISREWIAWFHASSSFDILCKISMEWWNKVGCTWNISLWIGKASPFGNLLAKWAFPNTFSDNAMMPFTNWYEEKCCSENKKCWVWSECRSS